MCGITGVYAFSENGRNALKHLEQAAEKLHHRGTDAKGLFIHEHVGLAHRRLSIIAPTSEADQPFTGAEGRYTIVFNGEIFNYKLLREKLILKGHQFTTGSDTEVVLRLYMQEGQECLKKLRGFFALAIYDKVNDSLFVARDRYGEKPLLYYKDGDNFVFGSELTSLLALGAPRELDIASLLQYLQLTYVPAPATMLRGVKKLMPGHYLYIKGNRIKDITWYKLPLDNAKAAQNPLNYKQQQVKIRELVTQAVADRLVADVPVGSFLSGGVDSSIVTALAAKQVPGLQTYSLGFPDHAYYDETAYARQVAQRHGTVHTEVMLTKQDIGTHLHAMLESLSEPFADSSALAVYALSRQVGKELKVALSGDGADELFGGYNKHRAEFRALQGGFAEEAVKRLSFLWELLPKTRNSFVANKVRQMHRFAEGAKLPVQERYWLWATWQREAEALDLLQPELRTAAVTRLYHARKNRILEELNRNQYDLNSVLFADWQLVLANDMLPKIDLMGMAGGLEIRSPFLDQRLVKFALSLPVASKIDTSSQKKILKESFKDILPSDVYNRVKKGFEIPLLALLQSQGMPLIQEYLSDSFVADQGIFDLQQIRKLRQMIVSENAATVQTKVWILIVFQYWWKNVFK